MTLAVLRKIRAFLYAGARVVGEKPSGSPSRSDDRRAFRHIATELWGEGDTEPSPRRLGRGILVPSRDLPAALAALGIEPDWRVSTPALPGLDPARDLAVSHREIDDGDLYFVSNRTQRRIATHFAVPRVGKAPEFWHADSGTTEPAPYEILAGRTEIPVELDADESLFVVLRKPAQQTSREIAAAHRVRLASLPDSWHVSFEPGRGAPDAVDLPRLKSWSEFDDPAIRYFSGVATYTQTFQMIRPWLGRRLYLDLGDVHDLARVVLNDEPLGIVWKRPYSLELTGKLHEGDNVLSLEVANVWVNRLIGDAQPGSRSHTVTNGPTYRADAPLRPAGLVGPVTLQGLDSD
jgi:hypothetical protein